MQFVPQMIKTLILDLDGPILDCKFRHYACYSQILNMYGYTAISLERYWAMKRNRLPLKKQLLVSGAEAIQEQFLQAWLEKIEQPDLLRYDCLQLGVKEKLEEWRNSGLHLILATMRRFPKYLEQQLVNFGLNTLLDHVLVCEHQLGGIGKAQQVQKFLPQISPINCLWIGDTEIDVEAARYFGCLIWVVTCGIRTKTYLTSLSPDFTGSDLKHINLKSFSND
jgi:phosphoglycolate phosphatase